MGEDVDFGDAARHARAELLLRKPAAPVQHQRAGAGRRDGAKAVKVQLRRLGVHAVGCADGDGQRVAAALGGEAQRVLRPGVDGAGDVLLGRAVGAHMADLRLQRAARGVGLLGHLAAQAHVFLKGEHAAIVHDRRIAQRNGLLHQLRGEAVVEVHGHRHARAAGDAQHHVGVVRQGRAGQQAFPRPDDDRRAQLLRGGDDAARHLQGDTVEQAHGVAALAGAGENGFEIDEHTAILLSSRWSQSVRSARPPAPRGTPPRYGARRSGPSGRAGRPSRAGTPAPAPRRRRSGCRLESKTAA